MNLTKSSFCLLILISILSCTYLQRYKMGSGSMEETIQKGDIFKIKPVKNYKKNQIIAFTHFDNNKERLWLSRIIGTPGDTVHIKNGVVFVNGQKTEPPKSAKLYYHVVLKDKFKSTAIVNFDCNQPADTLNFCYLSEKQKNKLATDHKIDTIKRLILPPDYLKEELAGATENNKWNIDHYGPLYIPEKGEKIQITEQNQDIYNKLFNAEPGKNYKIIQNLYFLLGDNRNDVKDSRYIGLIPEKYIVGKVNITAAQESN